MDRSAPRSACEQGVKINVICRCRPPTSQEKVSRSNQSIETLEDSSEVTILQNIAGKSIDRTYKFDKVFGPKSSQKQLYHGAISPIVLEVLEGFNCTVFAYGQTGTGKTYTMEGGDRKSIDGVDLSDAAGVIPRAIKEIFDNLEENAIEHSVKVSFMELYNEELTDLLSVADTKLKLMEGRNGVQVHGIEEVIVQNSTEIFSLLDRGSSKRRTAETLLNKVSSRSHSIFTIIIHMKESTPEGHEVIKIGKLNLVDLAGSENISRSGAKDGRAREAGNINQSLLTLGRVINALVEHQGHVPYRDSKLTRLLRDSLGGKTKTCIIATIAPTMNCQEETLSTLDYAHRAKNIRNKPEVNQRISKTAHIKDLTIEMDKLKAELYATREKNGVYLPYEQFKDMEIQIEAQGRRIEELESDLDDARDTLESNKEEMENLSDELHGTIIELEETQSELSKTTEALHQAQEHIAERDFLIAAHRRTESALATHAEHLTDELSMAADEIRGLFSKIRRLEEQESANIQRASEVQTKTAAKCSQLEQEIARNQSMQQGFHTSIQEQLDSHTNGNVAQLAQIREKVDQLSATVAAIHQSANAFIVSQASFASDSAQQVNNILSDFATSTIDMSAAVTAEARSLLDGLSSLLLVQREELVNSCKKNSDDLSASLNATNQLVHDTSRVLQVIVSKSEASRDLVETQHSSTVSNMATFVKSFEESTTKDAETLLSDISNKLMDFVRKKQLDVQRIVTETSQKMSTDASALTSSIIAISETSDVHLSQLESTRAKSEAWALTAIEDCKASEACMLDKIDDGAVRIGGVRDMLETNHQRAAGDIKDRSSALQQVVSKSASEMAAGAQQATAKLDGEDSRAVEYVSHLEKLVETVSTDVQAFHDSSHSLTAECSEHINNFCDSHASNVSGLAYEIQAVTNTIEAMRPTATTPRKRELKVPPREWVDDMRTPAQDVILAEFRMRRRSDKENIKADAVKGKDVIEVHVNVDSPLQA